MKIYGEHNEKMENLVPEKKRSKCQRATRFSFMRNISYLVPFKLFLARLWQDFMLIN